MKLLLIFTMLIYSSSIFLHSMINLSIDQGKYIINRFITQNIYQDSNKINLKFREIFLIFLRDLHLFYQNKINSIDKDSLEYSKKIKRILLEKQKIFHLRNPQGFSLLDLATIHRDREFAQVLLEMGFDINNINIKTNKQSVNIFPVAMWVLDYIFEPINEHMVTRAEMLQFFIDNQYDINLRDLNGKSILTWALNPEFIQVVSRQELKDILRILINSILKEKSRSKADAWKVLQLSIQPELLIPPNIEIIEEILLENIFFTVRDNSPDMIGSGLNTAFPDDDLDMGLESVHSHDFEFFNN